MLNKQNLGVKSSRARALYNAGFRTVRSIANAREEDIIRSIPNTKHGGIGNKLYFLVYFLINRRIAKAIINSAKRLLESQAEELRKEANQLLQKQDDNYTA